MWAVERRRGSGRTVFDRAERLEAALIVVVEEYGFFLGEWERDMGSIKSRR